MVFLFFSALGLRMKLPKTTAFHAPGIMEVSIALNLVQRTGLNFRILVFLVNQQCRYSWAVDILCQYSVSFLKCKTNQFTIYK